MARTTWWPWLLAVSLACTASPAARRGAKGASEMLPELLGPIDRQQVLAAVPDWAEATAEAEPDLESARQLTDVPPGAEVTVYLGTWCPDSRREVSRLWRVLEALGSDEAARDLPFAVSYVGVDRDKEQPAELISTLDLRYVPTFIVRRGPLEVGRIVEEPLVSVEHDLAALLHGEASGILTSSRPELLDEHEP